MSMIVFNFSTCVDAKKTDSTDQQITLGEKCGYLTGNYLTDKKYTNKENLHGVKVEKDMLLNKQTIYQIVCMGKKLLL